jgi:hypothetical protein
MAWTHYIGSVRPEIGHPLMKGQAVSDSYAAMNQEFRDCFDAFSRDLGDSTESDDSMKVAAGGGSIFFYSPSGMWMRLGRDGEIEFGEGAA